MSRRIGYSQEVRERAVRMVIEHEGDYASPWEAIRSIAEKIGCSPESLRKWLRRTEIDSGSRSDRRRLFFAMAPPEHLATWCCEIIKKGGGGSILKR